MKECTIDDLVPYECYTTDYIDRAFSFVYLGIMRDFDSLGNRFKIMVISDESGIGKPGYFGDICSFYFSDKRVFTKIDVSEDVIQFARFMAI
jgi:hypothetical protein